jgi:xanthine dehydrogenase accessory factor
MKHWKETEEILGRVVDLAAGGRSASLATVVRIHGSAYRRPGARFLVEDTGRTIGGVSGGCLEADVREHALEVCRTGVPQLLHYDTGSDDRTVWGLGLGCNGSVDVFVQPATTPGALAVFAPLRTALGGESPVAISSILDGPLAGGALVARDGRIIASSVNDAAWSSALAGLALEGLASGVRRVDRVGTAEVFTDALASPPHLVVCGAGDDARPLAAYAADAGFRVTVVDHREAYLAPERFPSAMARRLLRPEDEASVTLPAGPRSAVVLMTHSLDKDREWLRRFAASGAGYIGLLGPRERCARLCGEVGVADGDPVFGPVGLDLGADGPEQIAVSIVAEALAVLAGRAPRHLRDRERAIHAG